MAGILHQRWTIRQETETLWHRHAVSQRASIGQYQRWAIPVHQPDREEFAMDVTQILLFACLLLYTYATCGCWLLQVVAYPTYHLVGEREFVPFHVDFGKRLIAVFVVPAVLANFCSFLLVFIAPATAPLWGRLLVALCSVVILATTLIIEVPKHLELDKSGKSTALIDGLVRDNLPRAISWSVGVVVLAWMFAGSL
jgi:hypothetical protein